MKEQGERLRLTNSPPHSTTWIYLDADGRLTIEWYDYSDEAENSLGGDVAFLLYVDNAGKRLITGCFASACAIGV